MTDHPILFNSPMVRALLDGSKTQTRRLIKSASEFYPPFWNVYFNSWMQETDDGDVYCLRLHTVGDRLWAREGWRTRPEFDDWPPRDLFPDRAGIDFDADGIDEEWGKTRPSIFMPRWASRITLTVTDVRVQRVQDISAVDSIAEGVECPTCKAMGQSACHGKGCFASIHEFRALWDGINEKRGFGWDTNPWVAAYSFTVERGNIDDTDARRTANHDRTP